MDPLKQRKIRIPLELGSANEHALQDFPCVHNNPILLSLLSSLLMMFFYLFPTDLDCHLGLSSPVYPLLLPYTWFGVSCFHEIFSRNLRCGVFLQLEHLRLSLLSQIGLILQLCFPCLATCFCCLVAELSRPFLVVITFEVSIPCDSKQ